MSVQRHNAWRTGLPWPVTAALLAYGVLQNALQLCLLPFLAAARVVTWAGRAASQAAMYPNRVGYERELSRCREEDCDRCAAIRVGLEMLGETRATPRDARADGFVPLSDELAAGCVCAMCAAWRNNRARIAAVRRTVPEVRWSRWTR